MATHRFRHQILCASASHYNKTAWQTALPVLKVRGKCLILTQEFVVSSTEAAGRFPGAEELCPMMGYTQSFAHMDLNYSGDKIWDF